MRIDARKIIDETARQRRKKTGLRYYAAWRKTIAAHLIKYKSERGVIDFVVMAFLAYEKKIKQLQAKPARSVRA